MSETSIRWLRGVAIAGALLLAQPQAAAGLYLEVSFEGVVRASTEPMRAPLGSGVAGHFRFELTHCVPSQSSTHDALTCALAPSTRDWPLEIRLLDAAEVFALPGPAAGDPAEINAVATLLNTRTCNTCDPPGMRADSFAFRSFDFARNLRGAIGLNSSSGLALGAGGTPVIDRATFDLGRWDTGDILVGEGAFQVTGVITGLAARVVPEPRAALLLAMGLWALAAGRRNSGVRSRG